MAENGRLRRTIDRVRNEPGLGRNVTTLVALIALAGITGGIILSKQRVNWPWTDHFVFYAAFDTAPGVSPGHGQEVRIAGIAVGQIDSASVDSDGHAQLKMSIEPKYKVYDDATVVLRPKSPLNEMYVELNPGGHGKRLASGGKLPVANSQAPVQLDQALDHLDVNTRNALGSLLSESDAALANADRYLPGGLTAADLLTKQLAPVVTSLNTRRAKLQTLVTSLQEIASAIGGDDQRLSRLATSLQKTLDATASGSGSLNDSLAQLPDLMAQLKGATDAVQELSTELDPTLNNLKSASTKLPGSLDKVTRTVDQAKATIEQLKPVISAAEPVMANLRPLVTGLAAAGPDLRSVAMNLDPLTATLVQYSGDAGAFVVNTHSITSLRDANGGILRGLLKVTPSMLNGIVPALPTLPATR